MKNVERSIGLIYGDLTAELSAVTQYTLFTNLGVSIEITGIGSGDVTEAVYRDVHYPECRYEYKFTDGSLTGISLELEAISGTMTFKCPATPEMRKLYEQIMLTSHLLGECRKLNLLSHEEMRHPENWADVADIPPSNGKGEPR